MDTPSPRLVGGRYALLSRLGAGGMGTVWRARDEVLGREVAVKEVTFPNGVSDADRDVLRERTRREARAAARLDHPSAVTVYDVVEDAGAPYLVMELVEARTLADVVRAEGPLDPARTAQVGLALLGALEAAHAQGIVHRDVKPSNVMVRDDGRVVLTDFGIATSTGDPSITSTGLLLGSPAYISPERASGSAPGPEADLWALGATLFTAVEGRPPFDQEDALSTMMAVMTGEHGPFVQAGPLEPVLDGLLVKDPAERLDAAATRTLLQAVADQPVAHPTQVLTRPVAGAAAAAAAGVGAGAALNGQPASRTTAMEVADLRSEAAAAAPAAPFPAATAPPRTVPRPVPRPTTRPTARATARPAGRPGWLLPLAGAAAVLLAVGGGVALSSGAADGLLGGGNDTAGSSAVQPSTQPSPEEPAAAEEPAAEEPAEGADEAAEKAAEEQAKAQEEADKQAEEAAKQEAEAAEAAEEAAEAEDGGAPAGLPEGWTTDTGGAGWTVALPPGYARTDDGVYRTDSRRTLRVESGPGRPDAVADRQAQARDFASRHPTYRELRIERVDYKGYEAADWEFTFEGVRVLNRVFVVDGVGHSLWLQAPEGDFPAAVQDFGRIAEAFRPVGG